jgi:flagellar protein FlaG
MTILTTNNVVAALQPAAKSSTQRITATSAAAVPSVPKPADISDIAASRATTPVAAAQLEQVQRAIDRLKQSIKPVLAKSLEFEIDQSTGKTVVKILDKETNTVVRQIPSEELLTIAHAIDHMQGRGGLVKQQA